MMTILKSFIFILLLTINSINCVKIKASDIKEDSKLEVKKQAVILSDSQKSLINLKTEEEILELVHKSFDISTFLNILHEKSDYDPDQLTYMENKIGLKFGLVDKRAGRIVLKIDDPKNGSSITFGSGSFVNNKIFSNAHVLELIPLSSDVIFEQGRSLFLKNGIKIDHIVEGLQKYKKCLLDFDLYETDKNKIHDIMEEGVSSVYTFKEANILKNYITDTINCDIGYVDQYHPKGLFSNFSKISYSFNNSSPKLSSVCKITHYPLGFPIQRTSYGILDYSKGIHKINTLGGSSGGIITDYYDNTIGFHSAASTSNFYKESGAFSFADHNIFQNLSFLNTSSKYLLLNRNKPAKLLYSVMNSKYRPIRKLAPIFSLLLTKNTYKIF